MTDTKQLEATPEISTVENKVVIDYEAQTAFVPSSRQRNDFLVYKAKDNTPFYSVKTTNGGKIPECLSGKYTTISKAIEAIEYYIKTTKETFATRSDILEKERHAAKARSKDR